MRLLLALSLTACVAKQATPPASEPIVLPAQPDPPAAAPPEQEQPSLSTMSDEEAAVVASASEKKIELPASWTTGPAAKPVPFAGAMKNATLSQKTFEAVLATLRERDGGLPAASAFNRAASYVDYTSRLFAAAYYATDATPSGKVDALRAAAEMELQWSRTLDEIGLEKMPDAWRTDPSIALTFEDMTTGPVKRWRKEGLALVELCVATARESKLDTPSARSCLAFRRAVSPKVLPPEAKDAKDAGPAKSGCACDPGDPLCSATMNGWCAKTR